MFTHWAHTDTVFGVYNNKKKQIFSTIAFPYYHLQMGVLKNTMNPRQIVYNMYTFLSSRVKPINARMWWIPHWRTIVTCTLGTKEKISNIIYTITIFRLYIISSHLELTNIFFVSFKIGIRITYSPPKMLKRITCICDLSI